jgi:hypothetical protein
MLPYSIFSKIDSVKTANISLTLMPDLAELSKKATPCSLANLNPSS